MSGLTIVTDPMGLQASDVDVDGVALAVVIFFFVLVTFGGFWADVSNPFPWISGSWPVDGPTAFTGRLPDRYGFTVLVRTP